MAEYFEKVNDYTEGDDGVVLSTEKRRKKYDFLVLATGHGFEYQPSVLSPERADVFTAYPPEYLLQEVQDKKVMVIGSSLSGVEAALALVQRGAKEVHLFSRHGLLPHVKGPSIPYQRQYFTIEALEELCGEGQPFSLSAVLELLEKDIINAYALQGLGVDRDWIVSRLWPEDPVQLLQTEIREHQQESGLVWRGLLDDHEKIRQEVYLRLTPEDRSKLFNELHSTFMAYNAPMALPVAQEFLAAIQAQKIILHPPVSGFSAESGVCELKYQNGETNSLPIDMYVEATGLTKGLEKASIYQESIDSGQLLPFELGGLVFDLNTNRTVSVQGTISKKVFVLGAIVHIYFRGSATGSTLVGHARRIAEEISLEVLERGKN